MRILGGRYKGKKLDAGNDRTIRPVTNKIKESIFTILGDFFNQHDILDLFAGSGSFGLEALSRGANSVIFVESDARVLTILKSNIARLNVNKSDFQIIHSDALRYCRETTKNFELILSDPPFKFQQLQELVEDIFHHKLLARNGILVLHHEISNPVRVENAPYVIFKQKKYGRNLVSFLAGKDFNAQ